VNYSTISVQKEEAVATITLNKPDKLNSIDPQLISEVTSVMGEMGKDEQVRAVILTGAGRAFCAGGDVQTLLADAEGPIDMSQRAQNGAAMVSAMRSLPKPLIAAVNGPAVGGGCILALACDIIIAAEEAKFGSGFVLLGLHPDSGGIYLLTRLVGVARASELIFTGKIIDAQEAERIGLVNHVVPASELMTTVKELANRLAQGPTKAIGLTKATMHQQLTMDMASALELEARSAGLCLATEDANEGIRAFLEKRRPVFKGK